MSKPTRILYLVHHRLNRSPGQRYRCEQYLKALQEAGFEYTYSPLILNADEDYILYQSRSVFAKAWIFSKGFWRRVKDLIRAHRYDVIFIYREAFFTGLTLFEWILHISGKKIILDFDDSIWLPDISEANKKLSWLKKPSKINDLIKLADLTIVGNAYLANYARQFSERVKVFPSTIDLDYYRLSKPNEKPASAPICIGWSGSHTTIKHFETVIPALQKIKNHYGDRVSFCVYGDPHYKHEALGIKGVAWSPESEVPVISSFDIGIMPLPDDEWSRGKCSMKALQYMGLGVATVAAPVGMNKDVIEHMQNGLLASTTEEWVQALSTLIDSAELRKKLGAQGRKTIEERFSMQHMKDAYIQLFEPFRR